MNPAEQAQTFAAALLGDHGEALRGLRLTVTSIVASRPRTRWVPARADSLASAVLRDADDVSVTGIYVGVGLTHGASADAKRLTVADTAGIAWLSADIDMASPAHDDSKPYVPDQATAVSLAHAAGLAPTVIVHTGHGIQPHWRLSEPWIFGAVDADDDGVPVVDPQRVEADRRAAAELVWAWTTSIRIRAKQRGGWYVDPTGDLARLVRAAGTYNRKIESDHRLARLLDCDPARYYDVDQFNAALAPEELLAPYRKGIAEKSGVDLAGVDLGTLWSRARSAPQHIPDWLEVILESGWVPELEAVWTGAADTRYDRDDSRIDAALAAAVLYADLSVENAVEAVMCRRLRIGRKVEKVDPGQRVDYLGRTVNLVMTSLRGHQRDKETQLAGARAKMDAAAARVAVPDEIQVRGVEADEDDPVQPETSGPRRLRAAEPPRDPEELAGTPRHPRQGMEGPIPGPPDEETKNRNVAAMAVLGMGTIPGLELHAVEIREMEKRNELRIWLRRDGSTPIHGRSWPPHTYRSSRWKSTNEWTVPAKVKFLLLDEFGLLIQIPRGWNEEGYRTLRTAAEWVQRGTPTEAAEQAIEYLLVQAAGTELFGTAVTTGDPWVRDDEIWLPLANIREELARRAVKLASLVDVLGDLGCKVEAGKQVQEGNRLVRAADSWVRLADDLGSDQRESVAVRAVDRDAQDRRANIRRIGDD